MLEKIIQKHRKSSNMIPKGSQQPSTIDKNKIKNMMKQTRLRHIWPGGPLRPRSTSKFKDNLSEDNQPEEKMQLRRKISGKGKQNARNHASGAFGPLADILGPWAPCASWFSSHISWDPFQILPGCCHCFVFVVSRHLKFRFMFCCITFLNISFVFIAFCFSSFLRPSMFEMLRIPLVKLTVAESHLFARALKTQ